MKSTLILILIIIVGTAVTAAAGKIIPSAEQAKNYAHPEEHASVITLLGTDWILEIPVDNDPPVVSPDGKTIPASDNARSNAMPYEHSPVINPDWTLTVPFSEIESELFDSAPVHSDVPIQMQSPVAVPEPSVLFLFALGSMLIKKIKVY